MVAIVSGGALGLGASPVNVDSAAFGGAVAGRDGSGVAVNAATGNLVVQLRDEFLASLGAGGNLLRTYNSQGALDGDNNDGWRMGVVKTLTAPTGTVNQPGSTLTRTDGDGNVALYKYDAAAGLYVSTEGEGAYDTVQLDLAAGGAVWTDGATGTIERYDAQNRLVSIADRDGNLTELAYDANGMVSSVTQPGGNVTYLDYNGNQLTQVRTISAGLTEIRNRYTYDASGRLSQASIDLSPEDGSIADGNVYLTSYTYDGDSTRLATVTQSDGSSLAFTYLETGGRYQVASVTDALGQSTLFSYDGSGNSNVTDPTGALTTFQFDADGQLLHVLRPAVNGVRISNNFSYDLNGNLVGIVDGNGQSSTMEYDARGNLLTRTDPLGVTITRTWDAHNRLLSEVTGDAGHEVGTRYAYDAEGHLRFAVDGDGAVLERRYDNAGNLVEELHYVALDAAATLAAGNGALDQDALAAWAAGQAPQAVERSAYTYDFRGQLASASTFTTVAAGTATEAVARYVYDQRGRLLSTIDAHVGATPGMSQTSYAYDGLDRVLGVTDAMGNTTAYQYDDAGRRTVTTFANGLASTQLFDAAGRLVSVTRSDAASNGVLATALNRFDGAGRLVESTDANGLHTRYLYDDAGRQVATVDASGQLTEFSYDANGNLVRTVRYAQAVDPSALGTTADLAAVRPQASAADRTTYQQFDAGNRLVSSIDALGFVTARSYDSAGRLSTTVAYATALGADGLSAGLTPAPSGADRTVRFFYDNAGRVTGQLDAAGYLTVNRYDGAGNLAEQLAYANASDPALYRDGTLAQLVPDATGAIRQAWFYDGQGRQTGALDGEGYLTEMTYDADGNLASVVKYATRAGTAGTTLDAIRPVASAADQRQVFAFDGLHRVSVSVGIDGTRTVNLYDAVGHVVASTVSASEEAARTSLRRYDLQGRVAAELSPRGAALLTGEPLADAAIWSQYGTSYSYDAGGRLLAARAPGGATALYFYDALGRMTHSVNARGEVQENTYDVFGAVIGTKVYANRIDVTGLQGGAASAIAAMLAAIADPVADSSAQVSYDVRGDVARLTDGLGQATVRVYDAFGDLVAETAAAESVVPMTTAFAYDNRGLLTTRVDASGVLNLTTSVQYDAFGREISRTDARGNTSATEYDRDGRVVVLRDRLNASSAMSYDAFGRILTQTDGNGNVSQFSYDDQTRAVTVTTADGVATSMRRNADGQVVSVTDGAGAATHYAYDADGNLVGTTDALGQAVTREFDAGNHLVASVDANGMRTEYRYDAANRLLEQRVDADGLALTTTYQYDTRGETISVTAPSGVLTTTSYDANGQVVRTVQDAGGLDVTTQFSYDQQGHVLRVSRGGIDEMAQVTDYTYDAAGRLLSKLLDPDALALATQYAYDETGNLASVTDGAGNVTAYTYDAEGRLLGETNGAGETRSYAYDANGNRIAVTDANGNRTASTYDSLNRLIAQTDANGHTVTYGYDAAGRRTSVTDALGAVTTFRYDAAGRLTATVDALGNATTYGYDAAGNRISVSDAAGKTTSAYDSANRLVAVTDALGNVTTFTLDSLGRRIAVTDALGGVVASTYDGAGRLASVTDAMGATTTYTYDSNGNLLYTIDALGGYTDYAYDGAGRLSWAVNAEGYETSYEYDAAGNRITSYDANGATTYYSYDAANRLVEQSTYVAAADGQVATGYSYDGAGRLSSTTDGNGAQTFYAYDAAGQLVAQTDATGAVTEYAYDAAGNRVTVRDPNGNVTAYAYDAMHQMVASTDALGNEVKFAYDARGRRVGATDENGNVTTYAYDANDRLVAQLDAAGNAEQYRYDAVGNRIAAVDKLGNETLYHYDAAARLVGTDDQFGASESYAYDALGNLAATTDKKGATVTREYSAASRLVGVTDALGNHTSYGYDGVGNRTSQVDANGNTTYWHFDELNRMTQEATQSADGNEYAATNYYYDDAGNLIDTVDANGNHTRSEFDAVGRLTASYDGTGALTAQFQYDGAGNLVQKEAFFMASDDGVDSGITMYSYDALNRRIATTDSLGITQAVSYDAAGNVLSQTDGNGHVTAYGYDSLNRSISTVDALGGVTTRQYDAMGKLLSVTDRAGRTTSNEYDAAGRLVATRDPLGLTVGYAYDAVGNTVAVTDASGAVTLSTYDAANRLASTQDPLGNVVTFAYDAVGNRIGRTDARGSVSTFTYDGRGRLKSEEAGGAIITYVYDAFGNRLETTRYRLQNEDEPTEGPTLGSYAHEGYSYDAANRLTEQRNVAGQNLVESFSYDEQGNRITSGLLETPTRYYYDTENRLVGVRDPMGGYTAIEYDGAGNRIAVVDGNGNRTTYVYDALNRLVSTLDPTGHADTAVFDQTGNQVATTDRLGRTTTYEYDLDNRLTAFVTPDGLRTEYVLDSAGRHLSETLAAGTAAARTRTYAYDPAGRLLVMTAQDGSGTVYQYDAAGNAISRAVIDASGRENLTVFAYDSANRLVQTVRDPNGLALTEQVLWNGIGQIGQKIDAAGRVVYYEYDEVGRLLNTTSGYNTEYGYSYNTIDSYGYDDAGNLSYQSGRDGVHFNYAFDLNNRVSAQYDGDNPGTYVYDGAGNMVLSTDPQGYVTNNYYDSNNRLVAQLDGDDVLHEFDYDAVGNKIAERLYMDRQPDAHQGDIRPQGTGEVRTYTYSYDTQNRLVHTTYPTVQTTQVVIVNGAPQSNVVTTTPTETRNYDVFGNLVETVGVNGGRTVSYYDSANRLVAQVDPQGYLTARSYDVEGHVVETRAYAVAINSIAQVPGQIPAAPAGTVTVTSFAYDAAGRLVGQRVSGVELSQAGVDVALISAAAAVAPDAQVTQLVLDGSGNIIQEIRAPGLPEQQVSYSYYNKDNFLIGTVDAHRSMTLYAYNDRGGIIGSNQYAYAVDAAVDLASLQSNYFALLEVAGSNYDSKGVVYELSYGNEIVRETRTPDRYGLKVYAEDENGPLRIEYYEWIEQISYGYDGSGRRTETSDSNGATTVTTYDAAGRVTAVRQPDGVVTHQIYDAAGNVLAAYSGDLNAPAGMASSIVASIDNGLRLSYDLSGPGMSSYVVWDTVSHDVSADNNLGTYASQTRPVSAGDNWKGSATINGASGVIFYRVVTVDGAGNKSYSGELSVNAVPQLEDVQLIQSGYTMLVRVKFPPGISDPKLETGPGYLSSVYPMTLTSDGYYETRISPNSNPAHYVYSFAWTAADGSPRNSAVKQPEPESPQFVSDLVATETVLNGGVSASLAISLPPEAASAYSIITARWRLAGSDGNFATSVAATGPKVNLVLGANVALQAGQSYEVIISGIDSQGRTTILNSFDYAPTGVDNVQINHAVLLLAKTSVGSDRLVIVNGMPVALTQVDSGLLAALPAGASGGIDFYYVDKEATQHTTAMTSSEWRDGEVLKGYNLAIGTTLSAGEAAQVDGALHFSWRSSGSDYFSPDSEMMFDGTGYRYDLSGLPLPAVGIEYKIWYRDTQGRQVFVDWSQAQVDTNSSRTALSDITLASQRGWVQEGKVITNLRDGQIDAPDFNVGTPLLQTDTGLAGGDIRTTALEQGYGRRNVYDALNHLIGSTGDDGVWTDYGVDVDGNVLTSMRQDVENDLKQTAYKQFDVLGRITAEYGASFTSADGSLQREVTRYTYDAFGNVTSRIDAIGATTYVVYDALGRVTQQTDALGQSKHFTYNTLGQLLTSINENGGVTVYQYNGAGDRTNLTDAGGARQGWEYDAFGRVALEIDGNGNRIEFEYDSKDRLVRRGNLAYSYNDFEHTSSQSIANGGSWKGTTTEYDQAGRVIGTSQYNESDTKGRYYVTTRRNYDTYGNLVSETDGNGRTSQSIYGGYGRLLSTIDSDGRVVNYTYDSLGRRSTETGSGRNITYSYDEAGHLSQIVDAATGTTTRYSYDAAGRQVHESVTGAVDQFGQSHGREIDTQFDALGRMTGWSDSVTGMQESYTYDAAGNRTRVQGSGPGTTVDHGTDFDGAGRVIALRENGEIVASYTYDIAGNRATATEGGVTTNYTYDNAHRVLTATRPDGLVEWQYDSDGNITLYRETKDGVVRKTTTNTYDLLGNNSVSKTETKDDEGKVTGQEITNTFDDSGRLISNRLRTYGDGDKTYFYTYTYSGDGRQLATRAYGSAKGNATFTYDVNDNLVGLDQGQGDGQTRSELSSFVYDNSGKILAKYHDDGTSALQDHLDYVYVQGNPVARTGTSIEAGGVTSVLDSDNYALFVNIDSTFPSQSSVPYTVRAGETLQSIADLVYGNRNMWYLIADANGLNGDEALQGGRILSIPSASQSGGIDGDTHAVYSQDDVVGGTLPNLKSPPPPGHGCSGLLQILVVVVAVVVTVYTAGATAGLFAEGAAATGAAAGTTAGAVAASEAAAVATASTWSTGVAVLSGASGLTTTAGLVAAGVGGAAGSAVSQGVAIATGLQKEFNWGGVAQGFVGAAATAGVGMYAQSAVVPGMPNVVSPNALPGAGLLNSNIYVRSAVTNAATQKLAVATHLQDEFSWRAVGAAAVAAGVGQQVGRAVSNITIPGLADAVEGTVLGGRNAATIVNETIKGTASAVAQQKLATGHIDLRNAAMGAFGSSIGSVYVDSNIPRNKETTPPPGNFADDVEDRIASDPVARAISKFNSVAQRIELLGKDASPLPSSNVYGQSASAVPLFDGSSTFESGYSGEGWTSHSSGWMRSDSGAEIPFVQTTFHRDPYELAYRFGAGLTGAAEGVTIEPVRQVRDMLVAGYAVGYNELGPKGRAAIYPKMWSMTARAFDSGTSTERLMLQAVPFTSPFVMVHDGIDAGIGGDYGSLAEMAGGIVGGVAIGKGVQKYGEYGLTMGGLEPAYGARGRQRGAVAPILLVTPEVGGVPSSGIRTALAATVGAESAATQALVRLNSETVEIRTGGASNVVTGEGAGTVGGTSYAQRFAQTPISNGTWSGIRGESVFTSAHPDVVPILGDQGILYTDAYPNFMPVAAGEVNIPNMTINRTANFAQADALFGEQSGMTASQVKEWRRQNDYTWHEHENMTTMQLVPAPVNAKFGHVGGIGEINAGKGN